MSSCGPRCATSLSTEVVRIAARHRHLGGAADPSRSSDPEAALPRSLHPPDDLLLQGRCGGAGSARASHGALPLRPERVGLGPAGHHLRIWCQLAGLARLSPD